MLPRPITNKTFNDIVEDISPEAKYAAFWADGDLLPLNNWREMVEVLVSWCDSNKLVAMISSSGAGAAGLNLTLDWNTEYRNRGLTKMCFMYALSKMEEEERYSNAFKESRRYILEGKEYPSNFWRHAPVLQLNSDRPSPDIIDPAQYTYYLATVNAPDGLFAFIKFPYMGVYGVKLGKKGNEKICKNSLTGYIFEENDSQRYSLNEIAFENDRANKFASAILSSNQL